MAETTTSATIIDHRAAAAEQRAGRPASLVELGAGAGTAGGGVVVKYPSARTDGPSMRVRNQEQS